MNIDSVKNLGLAIGGYAKRHWSALLIGLVVGLLV